MLFAVPFVTLCLFWNIPAAISLSTNKSSSFRVLSISNEPFIYRGDNNQLTGIEYKLLKTIAEKLNFNLSLQFHKGSNFDLNQPHSSNTSDILLGGLLPNCTHLDKFEMSRPYYQDELTWCIQKAGYVPMIINAIMAGTPLCWFILIFGLVFGVGIVLYIMVQFDMKYEMRNHRDYFYTTVLIALPALIGFSQRFYPKSITLRLFYGFILLMMIFVWQIILLNVEIYIKVPVPLKQIATVDEIVYHEYHLTGSSYALHFVSFNKRYKKSQIESFAVCSNIDCCLEYLKDDGSDYLAVAGSRQRILNSPSYSASKIYCFNHDECIASYQPTILMRKNASLLSSVDRIIRNAFEGGLFVKWDRDSRRKRRPSAPFKPPKQIAIKHLSGTFLLILIACSVLAMFILFLEILVDRKMKRRRVRMIWKYLEHQLDGDRHYFENIPERIQQSRKI